ncbi:MAG TPA: carbohydrate-binding family 9-like protein, partial [Paludibacteraceae bacterium]|nr:carbohydrate-binding family 9-like protein [Paludibacteraceae bacterium]
MTTVSCSNNSENNQQLNVKDAASWMDKQGIEYKALECFNWVANDDSAPMAKVRISRTKDALVIDYHVAEYSTCGLENTDGG